MRSKKKKRALSGLLVAAMLTSMLNTTSVFSSSDYEEPQEASETVATTEAPAPETQAPTEETAPVTEAQTQAAAEATEAPESDAAATEQTTDGQTGTEAEGTEATTDTEKPTEKETETETEKEVRKNKVTFQVDDGALVTIKDIDITKDTKEAHEASQAVDGKIVFKVVAKDGYEITKVRVDDEADARKNEETKDEPNDYIIEGILTDNTVVKVEAKRIEKEVTVTYEAEDGGQVTNAKETINLGDEDVNFIGSTAQSGKDLLFTSWKDEDGEVVSNNAEFTPSVDEVTEDVTYTANFIEKDQVPAQDFEKTEDVNGLTVKVEAKKGIFPKDTTMTVDAVPEADALAIAQKAADEDKEVTAAVGVNITFRDADGKEIEPINAQAVKVKISLNNPLEGENFSVIHQTDDGNVTKVADANADGASFEANSFSIYAIGNENPVNFATYTFYHKEQSFDADYSVATVNLKANGEGTAGKENVESQKVRDKEIVYLPKTPELDGYVFLGWSSDKTKNGIIQTNPDNTITASVTETSNVNLYAIYEEAHYVFFMDDQGRISTTKKGVTGQSITTSDVQISLDSTHSVTGWYLTEDGAKNGDASKKVTAVTLEETNITLWPKVEEGHYLYYATGDNASYMPADFVVANGLTKRPEQKPTRLGYKFDGWVTEQNGTTSFPFGNTISENTTVYAKWIPQQVEYKVIFWKQSVTDDKNATKKTYDYAGEYDNRKGTAGTTAEVTEKDKAKAYTGFHYAKADDVTINGDGSTILNVYYDRDLLKLTFYYQNGHQPRNPKRTQATNESVVYYVRSSNARNATYANRYEGRLYRYNRYNGYYGYYGYYESDYDTIQSLPPANDSNRYYGLGYTWNNYGEYEKSYYELTRKSERLNNVFPYYVTYEGLYGQTLLQNGYTWPDAQYWRESDGVGLTFLDAFLFDDLAAVGTSLGVIDTGESTGNLTVNHYKQNLDGTYTYKKPTNSTKSEAAKFYFTNKYNGFTLDSSAETNDTPSDDSSWEARKVNEDFKYSSNLHVRYTRNTYKLAYFNKGTVVKEEEVLYEQPLEDKNIGEPARPSSVSDEFIFTGWYKDEACTQLFDFSTAIMPAGALNLYAGWEAPIYDVTVYADNEGSSVKKEMKVPYGEKIARSNMPTVYDANGTKIEQGDDSKSIVVPDGFVWRGWVVKDDDNNDIIYDFETPVYKNVELYPYYTSAARVYVVYDPSTGSGTVEDNKAYSQNAYADVQSADALEPPADQVFLHWVDENGTIYYPQDQLKITADLIEKESEDDNARDVIRLTAVYGDESKVTTLTYHSNYPETADDQQLTIRENVDGSNSLDNNTVLKVRSEDTFTKIGYSFKEWNTQANGEGDSFNPGDDIGVNNTNIEENNLYAIWEVKYIPVTIKKNVSGNMGDRSNQKTFGFTYSVANGKIKDQEALTGTFALSHDGSQDFKIQEGSTITVTETDGNKDGYTTSVSYEGVNGSKVKKTDTNVEIVEAKAATDGGITVTFTNDRNVTAPTGIGLNSTTPLLLILSAILLFFASFFYVRRNRVEEL